MHNPLKVSIVFEDYVLTEEFRDLSRYVEVFYEERQQFYGKEAESMKHNIRKKVTVATILVAMTAIVIISGVTVYGMLSMKSHTVQTSKELGHQAGMTPKWH